MKNPFTSESRDRVTTLDNGVISKLRLGETLRERIVHGKPQHLGLGDFSLKAMYDALLIEMIVAGHYEELHATLAADWGFAAHGGSAAATFVAKPHDRSEHGGSR